MADAGERGEYPFLIDRARAPWEIDLRPAVRALAEDLLHGVNAGAVSARFHRTLAAATAAAVTRVMEGHGERPVAISGGCFQNALLTEDLCARLGGARVWLNRQVPCGDGGLALGQAVVASQIAGQ